jgi:hypothetical protein
VLGRARPSAHFAPDQSNLRPVSRPILRKASKRQPSARTRPVPKPKRVTRARASSAVAGKASATPAKRSKAKVGQQATKAANVKAAKAKAANVKATKAKAAKANGLKSSASSNLPQLRLVKTAPNNMNSSSAKGSAKVASAKAKLAGGKAPKLAPAAPPPGNSARAKRGVSDDNLESLPAPKRRSTRAKSVSSALPQPAAPVDPQVVAYESEALSVLASESAADDPGKANAEIKRRLRDKKLGPYEHSRIEALRAFKMALADEIHRGSSSSYFTGSHGLYANPEDFDHARLARDFTERYPGISHEAVAAFIPIAVYYYYLR